jgi:predicted O-methyltransferase YrrM
MNAVLEGILEAGCVTSPTGERIPLHSHVPAEEGRFLQDVIHQIQPKVSLEIGCAFGVSSLYICEALVAVGAGRHIVIDPFQHEHWHGVGIENLKAAGFGGLIELHEMPSHQALPRLEAAGCRLDFVFIDGAHWFDYVMVDFFCIDRLLRVGGVVVFDDADWASVRKACRYILSNRAYRVFPESTGSALSDSWMRRMAFKMPRLRDLMRRIAKPEVLRPDSALHLDRRFVAMKKDADDTWIEGTKGGRPFDFHREF